MLRHEDLKTRLVAPTVFERRLPYVFNQIFSWFWSKPLVKKQNPRLRDLAAKNSRFRDAKEHKKTRFRDSLKTPPRFRDWNKIFRDPEFSGYHSPPLLFFSSRWWCKSSAKMTKRVTIEKSKLFFVIHKIISVIPYPCNYLVSYPLSLKLFCQLSLIPKTPNRASALDLRGSVGFFCRGILRTSSIILNSPFEYDAILTFVWAHEA